MAHKTIANSTGAPLKVVLGLRIGSDPADKGDNVDVDLAPGETKTVQYGDDKNPYLNGLRYEYTANGCAVAATQSVTERGSAWDNVLNMNSTLTIGTMTENVSGSN